MIYKLILLVTTFFYLTPAKSQTLNLNRVTINAGVIENYSLTTFEFPFTNLSDKTVEVTVIPKSFFTNPLWVTKRLKPNEKDTIKLDFYPNGPGPFNEKVKLQVDGKTVTTLNYTGKIKSVSSEYKNSQMSNQLSSEKEIVFMVVDADNYEFLPNAQITIYNIENNKSYIGTTDYKGVLKDKLPNGKYYVEGQVPGYNKEIVGTEVEPRRNAALIKLKKAKDFEEKYTEPEDEVAPPPVVEEKPKVVEEKPKVVEEKPVVAKVDTVEKPKIRGPRKNFNIILLLDNSNSMAYNDRMDVLKNSLKFLVNNYKPDDQLAIITFNDSVKTIMPTTKVTDKKAVTDIIDSIKTSGRTDGILGVNLAIETLKENTVDSAINMIILSTDGRITTKSYEQKIILQKIEALRQEGYFFSTISFGTSDFDDRTMEQMAEIGGGVYINLKKAQGAKADRLLLDEINNRILKANP